MLNCIKTGLNCQLRKPKKMSFQSIHLKNTVLGVVLVILLSSNLPSSRAATASGSLPSSEKTNAPDSPRSSESADTSDHATPSFSGNISWYGIPFHGKKTASGEIFDMYKFSAAHLRLPFGTKVLVEDPRTGNTVLVKVNDRGPFVKTRVMDVSRGAATKLGTVNRGVTFVDCLVISKTGT
jgi:rare lipoprotein A